MQIRPRDDPLPEAIAKHRPKRIKHEYVVRTAALELRNRAFWLWYWAWAGRLRPKRWVGRNGCIYLHSVESVLVNPQALREAAEATGERIPVSPEVWGTLHPSLRRVCVPVEPPEPEPNIDMNDVLMENRNARLEVSK